MVKVINPIITKKYQRASIRNSKTDRIDAQRLAEIGLLESDLPDFFDSRENLKTKQYQALLKKLMDSQQQLKASLEQAQKTAQTVGIELDLSSVTEAVDKLEEAITVLKKLISDTGNDLAKKLASEVNGLSLFQATVLTNAVEHREFETRDQLTAFFGLDVQQRQSGKWQGRQRLSKRGNPLYRHVLFQLGWSLMMNNAQYKEYYKHQKEDKQKHYFTAIIATARKFLRYFFKELTAYQSQKELLSPTFA
jgi:transposase